MGYPGAGVGSLIADLYGWVTGDENVDRQAWDQAAASLIFGRPSTSPKALGQGFTSGKAVYTPPPGAARLPAGTPGFPNVPGTAVPRIGTSGLPKSLPAGPRGYLNPGQKMISAPDGTQLVMPFKQGGMHNQFGGAVNPFTLNSTGLAKFIYGGSDPMMAMGGDPRKGEPSKIFQAISNEVGDINPNWENEYYHFNRGKGKVYKTAGDRFKTFKQDLFPNRNQDVSDYSKVTTVFQDGGSKDLTLYKTGKEKQEEFWTKHYRKPDTGEIINQETGAVVTLPDFTDDVTTQTGTSDYEKRIKELENQLAGFKSNAGVARDMYGRQLPPPLFNRRARDLAGMGSFLGMAGVLNPFEYVGSWNQYSDMYDPNTGERIPDEVRKRIGLPNLTDIDVRKSRLIGGLPKEYSLKFGMPGSASTSKEDLRENIAMDNNNSFSNIDSKGRLLREKEYTPYNRMSDKKWNKFKEKEYKKNIPEDYLNPELLPYQPALNYIKSSSIMKYGGMPRFQTNGEFNLVDTSAIEVDEDYLMGERPDYVQFYDDKEYMFSGKDDSFTGPAQVDVKEKDSYTFDYARGLDLFNVGANKVLQNNEDPDMTKFPGTYIYNSNMDVSDKGTHNIDSGLFELGKMGFEGRVQKGGAINDEIYMTEEEIEEFLRNGGQLEYL
jgi:hypothetical protein